MSALLDKVSDKCIGVAVGDKAVAVSFHGRDTIACRYYLLGVASTLLGLGKSRLALKVLSHIPGDGSTPHLLFEVEE